MSRESLTRVVVLAMVASALAADRAAYGVDPNALTSAYWRFEEGVADSRVTANPPANPQTTIPNTVIDSYAVPGVATNHMQAYNTDTAPKYINYTLPPTNLKSGLSNTLAWELDGSQTVGRDVYTTQLFDLFDQGNPAKHDPYDGKINNGVIGGMYDPDGGGSSGPIASTTTGFTLEAAFSVFDISSTRTIVAKEGLPGREIQSLGLPSLGEPLASLPTMALKVRGPQFVGDPDAGKLQIELFDGARNLVSVMTDAALSTGLWYSVSVVNDGSTLSLYLDRNDGDGYELVGSESVNGALFQGNYNNANWDKAWSIGKGVYGYDPAFENGVPKDFFNGLIDEVRLTNEALDPTDFLFYQEPEADGDFNDDGYVDGTDFLQWQRGQSTNGLTGGDLQVWKDTFGSSLAAGAPVPEPATLGMATLAIVGALFVRRRLG